jgi:hypothetical protein
MGPSRKRDDAFAAERSDRRDARMSRKRALRRVQLFVGHFDAVDALADRVGKAAAEDDRRVDDAARSALQAVGGGDEFLRFNVRLRRGSG